MSKVSGGNEWRIVLDMELRRLWLGGGAALMLLGFALLMSGFVLVLALDPESSVFSQRAMIGQTLQLCVIVGILCVSVLGADSFSGERDRHTLEGLLLTPVTGPHLGFGKLVAYMSLWLAMLPLAAPYLVLVTRGTGMSLMVILLLLLPGTLLVLLCLALALIVSVLASGNVRSLALTLAIDFVLVAPAQLPASVQTHPWVQPLMLLDPVTAVVGFQGLLIDGADYQENLHWLVSPVFGCGIAVYLAYRLLRDHLWLQGGYRA